MLHQRGRGSYRALKHRLAPDHDAHPRALGPSSPPGNAGPLVLVNRRPADRLAVRVIVMMMVLASTAVPVELRPLRYATLSWNILVSDVVANVVGYVPVGMVLGGFGPLWAAITASFLSTFAETSQLVMLHRAPSPVDVVSNVAGAILGTIVYARWGMRSLEFTLNRCKALVALALAFPLGLAVLVRPSGVVNARGATSPGTLEAYWKLDESHGRLTLDASGHGLHGQFSKEPTRVAGASGGAIMLDGRTDFIDFGHPTALRLIGSMTISAWIHATAFPIDDAAIVSRHDYSGLGYQLDTTVDRGLRTIGFKLANACGRLMARYGATPLAANRWYHVAGVYDAEAQTLDVYLNGELDNGFLLGPVTSRQRSSRATVYVGRRSDMQGFAFAGSINEVRIYSYALTQAAIASDMHGASIDGPAARRAAGRGADLNPTAGRPAEAPCTGWSDAEDAKLPGLAAALGVLIAVACIGLGPSARSSLLCPVVSLAVGWLLLSAPAATLPSFNLWTLPLLSLIGGASVAVSVRRQNDPAPGAHK